MDFPPEIMIDILAHFEKMFDTVPGLVWEDTNARVPKAPDWALGKGAFKCPAATSGRKLLTSFPSFLYRGRTAGVSIWQKHFSRWADSVGLLRSWVTLINFR